MNSFMIEAGRKRRATVTLDSQPGAHTGATRKYIPGYSDSNIVFLNTSTGNDANTGASIAQALLTYSAAATAASTTKKIRLVNSATLTADITKPTEATIGTTSSIASSSFTAPVNVWNQAGTPSFGASNIQHVSWVQKLGKAVAVSAGDKIAYSSDLNTWVQSTVEAAAAGTIIASAWSPTLSIALAVGTSNRLWSSFDLINWDSITSPIPGSQNITAVKWIDSIGAFVIGSGSGLIYYTSDLDVWQASSGLNIPPNRITSFEDCGDAGIAATMYGGVILKTDNLYNWSQSATPSFGTDNVISLLWVESLSKAVAVGVNGKIAYSTDLDTWTQAGTPSFGSDAVAGITYDPKIEKAIAVGSSGKIAYSTDLDTWTQAGTPSFGSDFILAVAYDKLNQKTFAAGDAGKIASSTAYATTISADVAGFSIQAVQYSGTVTAYNCTLKQPGTTAALSTENCRFTESGAHISNNAQKHQGLLVEGDVHFTTTPAAQNAFSFTRYTVAGRVYIHNASATYFEEIKDGIVTDGIAADYQVVVESGNVRGTCTNVVFGLGISVADPAFVDTTDYQLKREVNGYDEDSVCVAKSSYYYNSVGTRRDIGAWSYNETSETYIYERAYEMRKPSAKDATSHLERLQTSLYWGEDQTPDVATDPEARGEELTLSYRTLPVADINFIRYLRSLKDPTVRIDYDPQWQPATTVTVDGNQSAGIDVLLLLTSTLEAGQKLTIAGKLYYVMRMNGTTKAVLNQPLADGVTDTQVLTVSDAIGKGVYQVVPQSEMNLTRFYENNTAYFKGAVLKFVRKAP